ncbi:MAG: DUF2868 domain-containing protein [Alcaligenaceae bacterium]|nr:DUF2868 domain-containing protein [Alcaligenaceae bacterium]
MTTFNELWQTEAIRLKEHHHGPMDDSAYIYALRAQDLSPEQKIITRAQRLANASGLSQEIVHYRSLTKYSFLILVVLSVVSGIGLASAGLGNSNDDVNLLSAWIAILGLHILSFMIWLFFLFIPKRSDKDYPLLGQVWIWLTKKLSRGPHATMVPNALFSLSRQQRSTAWLLSAASHFMWLVILGAALLTVFFLLSTRSYTFVWETTILSASTLEDIATILGVLPALLGFPMPQVSDLIGAGAVLDSKVHASWSHWLIGQIVVYGLLLRLIAFIISFLIGRIRLARTAIDIDSTAYAPLLARLEPVAISTGIDSPAPTITAAELPKASADFSGNGTLIVGIELDPDEKWPLFEMTANNKLIDGGNIESREQRHTLLSELGQRNEPLQQILFVCDAEQTPDRSHLNLMQTIAHFGQKHFVLLINRHAPERDKSELWLKSLDDSGLQREAIFLDQEAAYNMLNY